MVSIFHLGYLWLGQLTITPVIYTGHSASHIIQCIQSGNTYKNGTNSYFRTKDWASKGYQKSKKIYIVAIGIQFGIHMGLLKYWIVLTELSVSRIGSFTELSE